MVPGAGATWQAAGAGEEEVSQAVECREAPGGASAVALALAQDRFWPTGCWLLDVSRAFRREYRWKAWGQRALSRP